VLKATDLDQFDTDEPYYYDMDGHINCWVICSQHISRFHRNQKSDQVRAAFNHGHSQYIHMQPPKDLDAGLIQRSQQRQYEQEQEERRHYFDF